MKTTVFQLRLSPEKKAEWLERAKKSDMNLSQWIESMCDRPDHSKEDAIAWEVAGGKRPITDLQTPATGLIGTPHTKAGSTFRGHAPNCTCMSCRGGK